MHMMQPSVIRRMILTVSESHPVTPVSGALQGAGAVNSGNLFGLLVLLFV